MEVFTNAAQEVWARLSSFALSLQFWDILDILVSKVGLKVPTSYIYKKYSIPKPEGDEEIAAVPAPATAEARASRSS